MWTLKSECRRSPLRVIVRIVNDVLAALNAEFAALYASGGRPCIAPERLLRALLLQAFYTIRSERQLMEQLHYNLLYRWLRRSPGPDRITVGGDKGFDTADFVADLRALNVTPHIAQDTTNRASAIDGRTTRHPGYAISQKKCKLVEEPFGWGKTIGGLARPMLRGVRRLDFKFTLTLAAYDLIKLPKLLAAPA